MSEKELLRRWHGSFEELALNLQSSGQDAAILAPIARHPKAALLLVDEMAHSSVSNLRCLAAKLAGRLAGAAPQDLLERLFDRECASIANGHEPMRVVAATSVVETLVFAAARWCREPSARDAGLALCRKVVTRTIDREDSEYWASAPYAMVTLMKHGASDADALLARFAAFADGPPPEFVTEPNLQNERACARALTKGVPAAIGRVDALIDKADAAPEFDWGEGARAYLDEWLAIAKDVG